MATLPLKVQPIALEPPCNQLATLYLDCLGSSMTSATQPTTGEANYQSSAEAMMMEDNCYKVVVVSCSVYYCIHTDLCTHTHILYAQIHTHTNTNHSFMQSRSEKTLSFELLDIQVDLTEDLPETKVSKVSKSLQVINCFVL